MQCFDGLKLYGKEPEQIENTVKLFRMVLADFPSDKIQSAFVTHLQRSSEMPTPSDIVQLINRGNKPAFDKAVYIRLEKKGYDARSRDEDEYMKEYEEFMIYG